MLENIKKNLRECAQWPQANTPTVFVGMPVYFPYLQFDRDSKKNKNKKKLGGVSLAWLSLRDFMGERRGNMRRGEGGVILGVKFFFLFVLSAVW